MNFLLATISILVVLSPNTHAYGTLQNRPSNARYESVSRPNNAKIPYQWTILNSNFPSSAIPIDVQPDYYNKNRLRTFVTIPKFEDGIPFTLATVSDVNGPNGPLLVPYPNLATHNNNNGRNCDAITSAFRVAITECHQMWVIDSGMVGEDAQCPPQLLLFDLNTDQLIHRYRFESSLFISRASLFITPIVDVRDPPPRGSCRNAMVYVADVNYHGLVVYDFMQNKAWRVENMYMYPDPNYGSHTVAGESFILMDGIFGIATDKKNLYFHPLASKTEYAVPLRILDNSTIFEHDTEAMHEAFRPLGKRTSECAASAMDSDNNLYCVTLSPVQLTAWNVNTPYESKNIKNLLFNSRDLQFVSGMKVIRNHLGNEELWMLSNRFQKLATGTQDVNEINYRIIVLPLTNPTTSTPNHDLHNQLIFNS